MSASFVYATFIKELFTHFPLLEQLSIYLTSQLIMDKRDRVEKEKVLAQYVVDSLNTHNFWAFKVKI